MAFLPSLLLALAVLPAQRVETQARRGEKPNILFLLTDDQRWDGLGCYGNSSVRTPNLDKLASEGVRLDAFYAASPVCAASRAAILSGLTPHQTGILNNRGHGPFQPELPVGLPTIATFLESAGYATGLIGKAHLGHPERWDFDEMPIGAPPPPGVTLEQVHSELAMDFIERHQDESWFLWLAYLAPHIPWEDHPEYPYDLATIQAPPGWPTDQALSTERWDSYYSEISNLDHWVGALLDRLDALGLRRNTFVFFMSDNGYLMGSHGFDGKERPLEESSRVCALARWPGRIKPNTTCAAPITSTDFFATALQLAGVEKPAEYECVSMLPAFTGHIPLRPWAYAEIQQVVSPGRGHWQMIYQYPWKYVTYLDHAEEMLFDLAADPHEEKDLAGRADYDKAMDRMRAAHAQWSAATAAPALR